MGVLWATAKSAQALASAACGLPLVAALAVVGHRTVAFVGTPVRSRWFIMLGLAVLAAVSFNRRFGVIEGCCSHVRRCHAARILVAGVPFSLGYGTALVVAPSDGTVRAWFALLVAVTVVAATVSPQMGWLATLVIGSGSILIDHQSMTEPVSQMVAAVGEAGALLLVGLATGVHLVVRVRVAS